MNINKLTLPHETDQAISRGPFKHDYQAKHDHQAISRGLFKHDYSCFCFTTLHHFHTSELSG